MLAILANGDGGEYALYLRGPSGTWTQLSKFEDKLISATFGTDGALYALSRKDAPRGKVLQLPLATPTLDKATVLIPEGEASIAGFRPTATRLYVVEQLGGPIADAHGGPGRQGARRGAHPARLLRGRRWCTWAGMTCCFGTSSYTEPPTVYRYGGEGREAREDGAGPHLAGGHRATWWWTRVMCHVEGRHQGAAQHPARRSGTKLNGNNPTLLTGYGGFNVSPVPGLQPDATSPSSSRAAWWPSPTCAAAPSSARSGTPTAR